MSLKREREKDCFNFLYVSVLTLLPAVLTSHFEFLLRHVDLTMSVPCLKSGWSLDPLTEQREPFMTWLLLTVPAQFSTLPLGHHLSPWKCWSHRCSLKPPDHHQPKPREKPFFPNLTESRHSSPLCE